MCLGRPGRRRKRSLNLIPTTLYHGRQPDPLLSYDSVSYIVCQLYTASSTQAELCRRHKRPATRSCIIILSQRSSDCHSPRSHQIFADKTSNNDQLTPEQGAR